MKKELILVTKCRRHQKVLAVFFVCFLTTFFTVLPETVTYLHKAIKLLLTEKMFRHLPISWFLHHNATNRHAFVRAALFVFPIVLTLVET